MLLFGSTQDDVSGVNDWVLRKIESGHSCKGQCISIDWIHQSYNIIPSWLVLLSASDVMLTITCSVNFPNSLHMHLNLVNYGRFSILNLQP